jgi:clan AA aspartic protease (TIGR02281 family)
LAASDRIIGQRAYGGVLILRAQVDQLWVRLLVDTGCAITSLTSEAAQRLGLDRSHFTGRRTVFTAAGTTMTVPTGRLGSLRLGAAELRNIEVALVDLPASVNIDGLLGVNVLDRFRVTFEFRRATLVLRPERPT